MILGFLFAAVDSYLDCLERATAAAEVVARFIQTLIELSEVRNNDIPLPS